MHSVLKPATFLPDSSEPKSPEHSGIEILEQSTTVQSGLTDTPCLPWITLGSPVAAAPYVYGQ